MHTPFVQRRTLGIALAFVLVLRLIHMRYALAGPLTWQMGADEDFYWRFAQDVAQGSGGLTAEFAFMDPLYGYLLGASLKLGMGAFPLYLLQIGVDCLSAFGLYRLGCLLGRPRAGLLALVVYGLTGTAIAYSMALLKATWVAAFVIWWMYGALRLTAGQRGRSAIMFGVFCGLGIALRANLLLMVPLAVFCIGWLRWRDGARAPELARLGGGILAGVLIPVLLLVARNVTISDKWSPMPNNGGIVLHQIYNAGNPEGRAGVPEFVGRYTAPSEIWDGYRREAERRLERPLAPQAVDAYWRAEAMAYLRAHPGRSIGNGIRKLREASAYPEVPNTRNYVDERIVSPLLAVLPLPFGWLFALGIPGLALLAVRDRRSLIVLAPLAMGALTLAVFFAEDRFRFNVIGPFVLGTGIWLDAAWRLASARRWSVFAAACGLPLVLGAWTLVQARLLIPPFPSDTQRLMWGYIKSGQEAKARALLDQMAATHPEAAGIDEVQGYLAVRDTRWTDAAAHLERAIGQRPDRHEAWHNFSLALEATGRVEDALVAELRAVDLRPGQADYLIRAGDLLKALGREQDARELWTCATRVAHSTAQQAGLHQRLAAPGEAPTDAVGHSPCPE
ncbi:glycosyltransferase family 39 protein [Luteimonas deserti]|uniref:Glycosyltransferase family 39 protein n=1 Tax=Luteimonas deserti TaxID=2752306 RepID=A0A7Z0QQ70_9GAMM|nr:glycosyltransferase family 39 protein [Luteimonas deserti]NYZ62817.1 glycosyltransferase family 39 protein [Luteimonas deserti]